MKFNSINLTLFLSSILIAISNASTPTRSYEVQAMIWDNGVDVFDLYGTEEGESPPPGHMLYLAIDSRQSLEVMVPFSSPSQPVSVTGTGDIVFYKQPLNPETPDAAPPIAARARVDSGVRDALVILVPRNLEQNDYQAAVIDNSARGFPTNTLRVINMSREPLGLVFGKEMSVIQPGSRHNFDINTTERIAALVVAQNVPGREKPVYRSRRIRIHEGARITCLLAPDPLSGRIQINTIVDRPPANSEKK